MGGGRGMGGQGFNKENLSGRLRVELRAIQGSK